MLHMCIPFDKTFHVEPQFSNFGPCDLDLEVLNTLQKL